MEGRNTYGFNSMVCIVRLDLNQYSLSAVNYHSDNNHPVTDNVSDFKSMVIIPLPMRNRQ